MHTPSSIDIETTLIGQRLLPPDQLPEGSITLPTILSAARTEYLQTAHRPALLPGPWTRILYRLLDGIADELFGHHFAWSEGNKDSWTMFCSCVACGLGGTVLLSFAADGEFVEASNPADPRCPLLFLGTPTGLVPYSITALTNEQNGRLQETLARFLALQNGRVSKPQPPTDFPWKQYAKDMPELRDQMRTVVQSACLA